MNGSIPKAGEVALDTTAAIDLFRGNEQVGDLLAAFEVIHLPFVVLGELIHGVHISRDPAAERVFLARLRAMTDLLLPVAETAEAYGRLKFQLRRKGRPIPENDLWIAALCVQHGRTLVTRDAHFAEVEGLATASW